MKKSSKFSIFIFTVIGVVLLCGAIFWWSTTIQFVNQSAKAEGTVIEISKKRTSGGSNSYAPAIQYTTKNGQEIEFVSSLLSRTPQHSIGQTVPILYSPEKPHKASINSFSELWLGPIIITILALAFFLTGGVTLLTRFNRTKEISHLKQSGMPVRGKVVGVEKMSYKVNNKHPYRLIVEQNQNGQIKTFKSDNIWFNPGNTYKNKGISVLIDPANSKKYYVALEELDQKFTA